MITKPLNIILILLLLPVLPAGAGGLYADQDDEIAGLISCEEPNETYTIEEGDHLFGIAEKYGSGFLWEVIYALNADRIANPHFVRPGKTLEIPHKVYRFEETGMTAQQVLDDPFCESSRVPVEFINLEYSEIMYEDRLLTFVQNELEARRQKELEKEAEDTVGVEDEEALEKFREAFKALVREEEQEEETAEQRQAEAEQRMFVEIDGMIHDETRSKVGRDFYDIFYSNWQPPEEASNYSIRITEQPAPNLGTIVAVEVNNTETFRTRLQPRYDVIEEAGEFAVQRTYIYLRDHQQQFQIY